MAFPGKEAVLSQTIALSVECGDCGHRRVRDLKSLEEFGVTGDTTISALSRRFVCSRCREDDLDGRNISVEAAFRNKSDKLRAEAYLIKSREVPYSARRAKRV